MQQGVTQQDIRIEAISSEDEKQVNHKKMRDAFIRVLKQKLAEDTALEQWQLLQEVDDKTESFELGNGAQSFAVHFKKDGLSLEVSHVNPQSTKAMMTVLSAYQEAHSQFHPKADIEFELICNNEQEARDIIEQARSQNIKITSLKFFNYSKDPHSGKNLPDTNQDKLLAKILSEPLPKDKAPMVISGKRRT